MVERSSATLAEFFFISDFGWMFATEYTIDNHDKNGIQYGPGDVFSHWRILWKIGVSPADVMLEYNHP